MAISGNSSASSSWQPDTGTYQEDKISSGLGGFANGASKAVGAPEFTAAEVILQSASRVVSASGCAIGLHDRDLHLSSCLASRGKDAAAAIAVAKLLVTKAGRSSHGLQTEHWSSASSDASASRVTGGTGEFDEFSVLVVTLGTKVDGSWSLIFVRDRDKSAFHKSEVEALKTILPMFEWLLSRELSPTIVDSGARSWQILDEIRMGVVLIGADGLVSAINRSGIKLLKSNDSLVLINGRLGMKRAADQSRFQRSLREIAMDMAVQGRAMIIESEECQTPLLIRLTRLGDSIRLMGTRHPCFAIFISDQSLNERIETGSLQQLFGLSRVEAEVVSLICSGLSPKEAAVRLDVTPNTVRGYLKSIFRKMGVHRQADLIRVVSAIP